MENPGDELLGITITPTGAAHIHRLSGITRWLFILGIFFCGLLLIDAFLRASYIDPEKYVSRRLVYWELKLHGWYLLIYSVLFISQLYFYVLFVKDSNKSLVSHDNEQFNNVFRFLYKSNLLAVIHLALSILLGALNVWMNYDLARAIKHV